MDTYQSDVDVQTACARGKSGNDIKSKMKKMDPNDFSIADFMAECKNGDEAESRFEVCVVRLPFCDCAFCWPCQPS